MTDPERQLVDRMNAATEQLNTYFKEIAAEIPPYGVTAVVKILEEDGVVWHLSWERTPRGWELSLQKSDTGSAEYERTPLLNASRRLRFIAAKNIQKLLDALRARAFDEAHDLERLGRDLEKVLVKMRGDTPRTPVPGEEELWQP